MGQKELEGKAREETLGLNFEEAYLIETNLQMVLRECHEHQQHLRPTFDEIKVRLAEIFFIA